MDFLSASPDDVVIIKTGIETFKEVSFSSQTISSSSRKAKIEEKDIRGSSKQLPRSKEISTWRKQFRRLNKKSQPSLSLINTKAAAPPACATSALAVKVHSPRTDNAIEPDSCKKKTSLPDIHILTYQHLINSIMNCPV